MKNAAAAGKLAAACFAAVASLVLWGCPNPNDIGVQQYGEVDVTCVQASNNQPVAGANVQIGQSADHTGSDGTVKFPQVPIGQQTILAHAPGLEGSAQVTVAVSAKVSQTVLMSPQ